MLIQSISGNDEPFLARLEEQDRFRDALRTVQAQSRTVQKVRNLISEQEQAVYPFIFLLYGEGGMGKSRLASRLRDIAQRESPFKGHFRVVWLDWERKKELDYRLASRDSVSPDLVFEHIYASFRDEGFGNQFDKYEQAIKDRAQAETKVAQAISHPAEGVDRYATLRQLGAKGIAWLVRTGIPGATILPEESTTKTIEMIVGSGAEALSHARNAATTLVRSSLDLLQKSISGQ